MGSLNKLDLTMINRKYLRIVNPLATLGNMIMMKPVSTGMIETGYLPARVDRDRQYNIQQTLN